MFAWWLPRLLYLLHNPEPYYVGLYSWDPKLNLMELDAGLSIAPCRTSSSLEIISLYALWTGMVGQSTPGLCEP